MMYTGVGAKPVAESLLIHSFDTVWEQVRTHNLELKSAKQYHSAMRHAHEGRTQFSNPQLEFEAERVTTGDGPIDVHTIELGGRLTKTFSNWGVYTSQGALGELDTLLSALALKQALRSVHHSAKKAFGVVVIAQNKQVLSKQSYALAQKADALSRGKFRAGAGSPIDSMRTGIQLIQAELELERAKKELLVATNNLELWWGSAPRAVLDSLELPKREQDVSSWDALKKRLRESPEWQRATLKEKRSAVELSLAKASRIPEFELSVGVQAPYDGEGHTISGAIAIPLPVLHLNGAAISEAHNRSKAVASHTQHRHTELTLTLKELLMQYTLLGNALSTTKKRLLPMARSALNGVLRGYAVGKFTGQELLDARSEWLDSEYSLLEITRDYYMAGLEIEYYMSDIEDVTDRNFKNNTNGESDENP
ncbi:MAG: TolC family protein [Fibrobacterales bacterium]